MYGQYAPVWAYLMRHLRSVTCDQWNSKATTVDADRDPTHQETWQGWVMFDYDPWLNYVDEAGDEWPHPAMGTVYRVTVTEFWGLEVRLELRYADEHEAQGADGLDQYPRRLYFHDDGATVDFNPDDAWQQLDELLDGVFSPKEPSPVVFSPGMATDR